MAYIYRDGKVYEQTIIEEEVFLADKERKLQSFREAIANDERELAEYQAKIAEIDTLDISDEYKEKLKGSIQFYSGSGIRPIQITQLESEVNEIQNIINGVVDVPIDEITK
jgi:hypothetical protein